MKQLEKIYNESTDKEQVAEIEYYRSVLLLAGIEYTSEHRLQNGYSPGSAPIYSQPWLLVMTEWGPLTIGWRKRVIQIDWSDSKYPKILIAPPDPSITHDKGFIHCYGYEQAISALRKLKLQFERNAYYDSLDEPKKSEEMARLKASEEAEVLHRAEYELEAARKLVAKADAEAAKDA